MLKVINSRILLVNLVGPKAAATHAFVKQARDEFVEHLSQT
jgi:hypothetical protein